MRAHRLILVGSVSTVLLLGACSSGDPGAGATGGATGSETTAAPDPANSLPGANGELFTSTFVGGESASLRRYPIAADGTVGEPVLLLETAGNDVQFPAVLDSADGTVLTASMTDYWSTEVQTRNLDGTQTGTLPAEGWCGGEGLTSNQCVLLADGKLARTSELGGEETTEGSVTVSDLSDGSEVAVYGPFPGLSQMLGTSEPNTVLLVASEKNSVDDDGPGTIVALNTTTGATSDVVDYPAQWSALCAVGTTGIIGTTYSNEIVGVGEAEFDTLKLADDDMLIGCSSDGKFVYSEDIPAPPDGEDDEEAPSANSTLTRITVADGERTVVATFPQGELGGPIGR